MDEGNSDHNQLNCGGNDDHQAKLKDKYGNDDDRGDDKSSIDSGEDKDYSNPEGKFDVDMTPETSLGEANNNTHNYVDCGGQDHDQENPSIDSYEEKNNKPDSKCDLLLPPKSNLDEGESNHNYFNCGRDGNDRSKLRMFDVMR